MTNGNTQFAIASTSGKKGMNIRKGQTDRKRQFFKMKYENQTLSSPNILAPGVKSLFFVKGKVQNKMKIEK